MAGYRLDAAPSFSLSASVSRHAQFFSPARTGLHCDNARNKWQNFASYRPFLGLRGIIVPVVTEWSERRIPGAL